MKNTQNFSPNETHLATALVLVEVGQSGNALDDVSTAQHCYARYQFTCLLI